MADAESVLRDLLSFRFVKLSKVREWSRFKRYQDLEEEDYELRLEIKQDAAAEDLHLYFISHRWITPDHPDPDGAQLSRVKGLRDEEALLFYDYCALSQRPRDEVQQWLFPKLVRDLSDIVGKIKVIILNDPEYMTRSWCLMEYFMAAFRGCLVCDEVRNEHLLDLQATANALVPFRESNSAMANFEAARSKKMGQIAHWFFGIFQDSQVTNGSDRERIVEVLRLFLEKYVGYYRYEPYLGWVRRPLTRDEVERMLRGEEVELVEQVGIPLPQVNPLAINVPRSLEDMGDEVNTFVLHRWMNLMARFFKLSDASVNIGSVAE